MTIHRFAPTIRALSVLPLALGALGCGDGTPELHAVRIIASGEAAAVGGYPTTDVPPLAFRDGWSLSFTHVLVSLNGMTLVNGANTVNLAGDGGLGPVPTVIDLHAGNQTVWEFPAVPAGRWDVAFRYGPPTATSRRVGTIPDELFDAMVEEAAGLYLTGTATRAGTDTVNFEIGIPINMEARSCMNPRDGGDGLVVPETGLYEAELTFHLDHLFFDSGVADMPNLRFEAWAGAANAERNLTYADLRTQAIDRLLDVNGDAIMEDGMFVRYPPPSNIETPNLRSYVKALAQFAGHLNGEGECEYRDLDLASP